MLRLIRPRLLFRRADFPGSQLLGTAPPAFASESPVEAAQTSWNALAEIERRYGRFLAHGAHVVDLGAAPGTWSRYAAGRVGLELGKGKKGWKHRYQWDGQRGCDGLDVSESEVRRTLGGPVRFRKAGRLVCVDVREMEVVRGAAFVRGDFQEKAVRGLVVEALGREEADVVLSDCVGEESGEQEKKKKEKHRRLAREAFGLVKEMLRSGGVFVCRLMKEEAGLREELMDCFLDVKVVRSRAERRVKYLFATGFVPPHLASVNLPEQNLRDVVLGPENQETGTIRE